MSTQKEKVVVTGGSGFIGTHLVEMLSAEYEVEVVDLVRGTSILDTEALARAFAGATYVFHLAAIPEVQLSIEKPFETHEVNVTGTLAVLCAARAAKVKRVVFSASSAAYGDQDTLPLVETMTPRPQSPYALHKYIGEQYAKLFSELYGLQTVSLRYFNVYGPGATAKSAYSSVISVFLAQRAKGEPLTVIGDGLQTRDFVHVRDVARANILAARSERVGAGEVINIGAGEGVSVLAIAQHIGGEVVHVPSRVEPRNSCADVSRAKDLLGWEPSVTFAEGITALLEKTT